MGGCIYNEEPMPKIVYDYGLNKSILNKPKTPAAKTTIPRNWIPAAKANRKWTAVVIHHSGTKNGSLAIFDRWHKKGNHWEGVGYDFVIGNGTNTADGQTEVTYRWKEQLTGAHCGTDGNWANKQAVGICLVGNFNKTLPTKKQMDVLAKLTRFLQERYRIPKNRIYGHKLTPGARATDCPGKKFTIDKLKAMLDI